jgi:hypothetical protein
MPSLIQLQRRRIDLLMVRIKFASVVISSHQNFGNDTGGEQLNTTDDCKKT